MSFQFVLQNNKETGEKEYLCRKEFEYKGQKLESTTAIEVKDEEEFKSKIHLIQQEMMVAVDRSINEHKLKN